MEARGMSGLGGLEGTISDRVSMLRYSERRVLGSCMTAKNKTVRGAWGGSPGFGWIGRPKADNILLVRWGVTYWNTY